MASTIRCPDCLKCAHCDYAEAPTLVLKLALVKLRLVCAQISADNEAPQPQTQAYMELRFSFQSFAADPSVSASLLTCSVCEMRVHSECLDPPLEMPFPTDWVCHECRLCRCCGTVRPQDMGEADDVKGKLVGIARAERVLQPLWQPRTVAESGRGLPPAILWRKFAAVRLALPTSLPCSSPSLQSAPGALLSRSVCRALARLSTGRRIAHRPLPVADVAFSVSVTTVPCVTAPQT